MRLSLWLGLFFAFAVGMCCALLMRAFYFEAEPVAIQRVAAGQTTQILVATRTIPSGIEITGEFVAFQDVAVDEVPEGAFSNFNQVFRRQSAFPIPAGCPICEELLIPHAEDSPQGTFVPPGSQFVALDVLYVRHGRDVFPLNETLSTMFAPDQRIDIRVVPRDETPGRLAELRNQVLRTFGAYGTRGSGELVLEDVPIHHVQRRLIVEHTGLASNSLVLMLDRNEAARLTAAARRGQIRVLPRQSERTAPPPIEIGNFFEMAQQPRTQQARTSHDLILLEQPSMSPPVPVQIVPTGGEQRIAPMPPDIFDTEVSSSPVSAAEVAHDAVVATSQISEQLSDESSLQLGDGKNGFAYSDGTMIFFGTPLQRTAPLDFDNPAQETTSAQNINNRYVTSPILRTDSEVMLGNPRIAQSIQFIAPNSAAIFESAPPSNVPPQETMRQADTITMMPVIPSTVTPTLTVAPSSIPVPFSLPQEERAGALGYSPFERRVVAAPSKNLEEFSDEVLSAPPLLQKNADDAK